MVELSRSLGQKLCEQKIFLSQYIFLSLGSTKFFFLIFSEFVEHDESPAPVSTNGPSDPQPKLSEPAEQKMKGYKDFKQLQKEMREKEKELKRKLREKKREKKRSERNHSEPTESIGVTSSKSAAEIPENDEDDESKSDDDDEDDDDLPDTYIEEVITERQFVDKDGSIKTEITTVEVNIFNTMSKAKLTL